MTVLVTGGAGFIGSAFVHEWLGIAPEPVIVLDKLTYAGNPDNLPRAGAFEGFRFEQGDIADTGLVSRLLAEGEVRAVVNFAAESHVDRSIVGADEFVQTNVVGTFRLLEAARAHWQGLDAARAAAFRFLHVSTDEVYGTLAPAEPPFTEARAYAPNSPYAASKAASDHLVRAHHATYGLPALITNCSNNYGPRQFPEKLLPLVLLKALAGERLPIYGDGLQVRDWLYVGDHCAALRLVLEEGRPGEVYNVGGGCEMTNLDAVRHLCAVLDRDAPRADGVPYAEQIVHVTDRPGHDRRYAIDHSKISRELGWRPRESFESGLQRTVRWYLDNAAWVERVTSGAYREWIERQYGS